MVHAPIFITYSYLNAKVRRPYLPLAHEVQQDLALCTQQLSHW